MAESPSHKFGQAIGNLLEEILQPILVEFCSKYNLYLDIKGKRDAREGKKVIWVDKYGNSHDLDFVIEKGGTADQKGRPVAFIEAAWRRYTKHSRNKAQEIQGAILPIAEKHEWDTPFLGAVIAGIFTEGSISQLESVGFHVLYIPYDSIVAAFVSQEVDVQFGEDTKDKVFKKCYKQIEKLPQYKRERIKEHLISANKNSIDKFKNELRLALEKLIEEIIIIPLYGKDKVFHDISSAISFVNSYQASGNDGTFRKYEVIVKYSNGDSINASFSDREKLISFLEYLKR